MRLYDLLFPKNCLRCNVLGSYLCADCLKQVAFSKSICPMCGKAAIDGMTHTTCLRPYGMNGLCSLWEYKGVIKMGVKALKYKYAKEIAQEMGDIFFDSWKKSGKVLPQNLVFIPIPLHKKRENWRGFNQADEVGKLIAEKFAIRCLPNLLIRKSVRKPQAEVSSREVRLQNARGIFSLNTKYKMQNMGYLLFDDVWTTGATMREAAKVLKRNGAKEVWGMTIAH